MSTAGEISAHNRLWSYHLTPADDSVRVLGAGGQSVTLRNLGPGGCRTGAPGNDGRVGTWNPLDVGSSVQVTVGAALVVELLGDNVADAMLAFSYP